MASNVSIKRFWARRQLGAQAPEAKGRHSFRKKIQTRPAEVLGTSKDLQQSRARHTYRAQSDEARI
jgi:hypothetical protein